MESSGYLHNQSNNKQDHVYTGHSPLGVAGGWGDQKEGGGVGGTDEQKSKIRSEKNSHRTPLVAQWLRICLPMQGTWRSN